MPRGQAAGCFHLISAAIGAQVTCVGECEFSVWCEIDAEASGKAAEVGAAEHAVHEGEQFDWGVAMAFFCGA
jgi:hypothetical protein